MDADLTALAEAQAAFLAEARTDPAGFGDPEPAHWDAAHVVAHLLINEHAMLAVTDALAAGEPVDYDNAPTQDAFVMARTIADAGSFDRLVDDLADAFTRGLAALGGLSPDQRATEVHVRAWHEGERVLDGPRPWWAFAVGSSTRIHLPAHVEQLRNLRR